MPPDLRYALRSLKGRPLFSIVLISILAIGLGIQAGPRILALAALGGVLGLLHERLRDRAWSKPLYVSLAWTIVVVGFPAAAAPVPADTPWVAGVVFGTGMANVWLYNLRPGARLHAQLGTAKGRGIAAGCVLTAMALALLGPADLRPLVALPAATGIGLFAPKLTERSVAWAIDGYLLLGALGTLLFAAA